jgi:hypothetical protein
MARSHITPGSIVVAPAIAGLGMAPETVAAQANSVVAQADCGSRARCGATQVTADPKTGAVTFTGLVLTGVDGNTLMAIRRSRPRQR